MSFKLDMTDDQRFSMAQSTKNYLAKTVKPSDNRINVKVYLQGDLPAELQVFRNAIEDKLKDIKRIVGDRIEFQFEDPMAGKTDKEFGEVADFLSKKDIYPMTISYKSENGNVQKRIWPAAEINCSANGITIESAVQFLPSRTGSRITMDQLSFLTQGAINNLEYNLMSAIRKVSQEKKKKIGFLLGHGELKQNQLLNAKKAMSPYFEPKFIDFSLNGLESLRELNSMDGLIIANPTLPFSERDLYLVDQFVMHGGKLMVFANTLNLLEDTLNRSLSVHTMRNSLELEKLLFSYGIKLQENYAFDINCDVKFWSARTVTSWPYYILTSAADHPISKSIEPVSMKYCNQLKLINVPELRITPILTTSSNAGLSGFVPQIRFGQFDIYGKNPSFSYNPLDPNNKITLAAVAEGKFKSYFQDRVQIAELYKSYIPEKYRKIKVTTEGENKVVVVGNGTFLSNDYKTIFNGKDSSTYSVNPNQLTDIAYQNYRFQIGNKDFLMNILDYMTGESNLLELRSKQIQIRKMNAEKVKTKGALLKYVNLILPVFSVLILGLVFYFFRYKKFAKQR
ncbi:MAG: GldG family protein [Flavobacteriales bacterium]